MTSPRCWQRAPSCFGAPAIPWAARQLIGEVRDIFAALGTRDEQAMVEDALGEVDRGSALSRHHHVRSVRPPAGPQSAD